jgi:DNA-directed RNA polymerase specialized sigma24 family protein
MSEVTRILSAIEEGDPHAAEQLLPLVYDELRKLAAQRLAQEKPGQTLQPTALVHEAYLRLVDVGEAQHWDGRGHFFSAAAEAMRRILIDQFRRKRRPKHGGDRKRIDLPNVTPIEVPPSTCPRAVLPVRKITTLLRCLIMCRAAARAVMKFERTIVQSGTMNSSVVKSAARLPATYSCTTGKEDLDRALAALHSA